MPVPILARQIPMLYTEECKVLIGRKRQERCTFLLDIAPFGRRSYVQIPPNAIRVGVFFINKQRYLDYVKRRTDELVLGNAWLPGDEARHRAAWQARINAARQLQEQYNARGENVRVVMPVFGDHVSNYYKERDLLKDDAEVRRFFRLTNRGLRYQGWNEYWSTMAERRRQAQFMSGIARANTANMPASRPQEMGVGDKLEIMSMLRSLFR